MSDEELDREWKPNNRPQSTLARAFSASLNDVFMIDSSLADLGNSIDSKRQSIYSQNSELEALEARLRQTEEKLKQRQSNSWGRCTPGRGSPHQRSPIGNVFASRETDDDPSLSTSPTSPLAMQSPTTASSRPPTAQPETTKVGDATSQKRRGLDKPKAMPEAMPATPTEAANEGYVIVNHERREGDADGERT